MIANWVTTGDHLIRTLITEPYLAVAGVDLSLLATAMVALLAARRLQRAAKVSPASRSESLKGEVAYD